MPLCLDMQDSYGDGWNGAAIEVSINGVLVTSFTIATGAAAIDSISTYTGDNVSFDFVSGTWDTEIPFTITAPDGTNVGSYGPYANNSGNDGPIWSGVSNSSCAPPACLDPYGLSSSGASSSSVDLSWSAGLMELHLILNMELQDLHLVVELLQPHLQQVQQLLD